MRTYRGGRTAWQSKALRALPAAVLVLSGSLLSASDCTVGPDPHAVAVLEQAIADLDADATKWASVLQSSIDALNTDAEKLIREELSNMLTQAIQSTGIEVRCGLNFIGDRIKEQLQDVLATLTRNPVPPLTPVACLPNPASVDASEVASDRTLNVVVDGYNFPLPSTGGNGTPISPPKSMPRLDASGSLELRVLDTGGATHDFSKLLVVNTFFELTIPFGGAGVQLTTESQRIVISWSGKAVTEVAVTQPITAPPCVLSNLTVPSHQTTYTPTHLVNGDKDFWAGGGLFEPAHPVDVSMTVTPHMSPTGITADVLITFTEQGGDYTTVTGKWTETLYSLPADTLIQRVVSGGGSWTDQYRHFEPSNPYDLRYDPTSSAVKSTRSYGFLGNVGVASVDIVWRDMLLLVSGPPPGAYACTR